MTLYTCKLKDPQTGVHHWHVRGSPEEVDLAESRFLREFQSKNPQVVSSKELNDGTERRELAYYD